MKFSVEYSDGGARAGVLETGHGVVRTPAFMPVGTQGSVKAVGPRDLEETGCEIILANTYHLMLRPGSDVIRDAGGLHRFMSWSGPLLTDSGGYQVFSLSDLKEVSDEGVEFRSHLDGARYVLTPEGVIDIQRVLGSDVMMALDECVPYPCDAAYARKAHELTLRWARRCRSRVDASGSLYDHSQAFFSIVQGSTYRDLRRASIGGLLELDCDGYAIGGLAVGEPADMMHEMTAYCTELLPADRPRYLMGVGKPLDLLESIERGVDMFDCVVPTRNGRNAMVFTKHGPMSLRNAAYRSDFRPIDEGCACLACRRFSRSYLRHLFQAGEVLALHLATVHNLAFYQRLLREARGAIASSCFVSWKREMSDMLAGEDIVLS